MRRVPETRSVPYDDDVCRSTNTSAQQCGHHHEALQKISDQPLRKCPDCGTQSLKRLVSAPVFRLKGSGWYETDFKSDKEAKRNLAEKADKDEAKADGRGGSDGETKAEPRKPAKPDAKGDPRSDEPRRPIPRRAPLPSRPEAASAAAKPAAHDCCAIEIERTDEARAPRASGAPAQALRSWCDERTAARRNADTRTAEPGRARRSAIT